MERKEDEGEAPRKRDQKRDQNIRVLWQTVRAMGSGRGVLQPQPRPRTRANPIRRCLVWGRMECYPFPGEGEGGGMRQDTHENWGFSWQDWGDWGTARGGGVHSKLQTPKRAAVCHHLGEGVKPTPGCVPAMGGSRPWLRRQRDGSPVPLRSRRRLAVVVSRVPTPHTKTRSRWPRARGASLPRSLVKWMPRHVQEWTNPSLTLLLPIDVDIEMASSSMSG